MKKKTRKLTIGMRARFKDNTSWTDEYHKEYRGKECLLEERSNGSFSVHILGQKKLIKKDPNTITGGVAWVDEECLEFVDAKFKANLEFMDWYQEHEDEFCGDCGAWFPDNGRMDGKTGDDYRCPNEKCPGNKHADGCCPWCDPNEKLNKSDKCPKCGWTENEW